MKKLYTAVLLLLAGINGFSQQFFTAVPYKGAFGGAGSIDWTAGWANWDPENTNYPAPTITVSSDIISNTTWITGSVINLQNKVYVTNNATLTIQPGVIIRGDKATESTLIISKGSRIMAQGTASNPIVFTSGFDVSDGRSPGDWGGLIILGNARINVSGGSAVVEGGLDPVKANFGGTNDADNSGVLQYVRIEFPGYPFQPDKEINGLTLGGVGSGTTLDHVQVSFSNDDSFEWFGGTVNSKYLIAYRGVDDNFDTDNGFSGKVQFALGIRDGQLADQCTCSTSEGFESDNDASGTTATPSTSAIFSNVTEIGPYRGSIANPIDPKFKRGLRLRRNTSLSIFNSVFTDWPTGLHIDGSGAEGNATNQSLEFESNVLAGMGTNLQVNSGSTFDINTFFASGGNTTLTNSSSVGFINPYPVEFLNPDYRLTNNSPLLTGADFSNPKLGTQFVGTTELKKESFNLYPNPSSEFVTIQLSNSENSSSVKITDMSGKIIIAENLTGKGAAAISTSDLSSGVYLVMVQTADFSEVKKLVVKH